MSSEPPRAVADPVGVVLHAGPDPTAVPLSLPPLPDDRNAVVGISATARPQGTCTRLGQKPNPAVWAINSTCGIPKRLPGSLSHSSGSQLGCYCHSEGICKHGRRAQGCRNDRIPLVYPARSRDAKHPMRS